MAEEKTIFVTGAASGIGRKVAELFSRRGWRVGLADIDEAGLATVAAGLPAERTSVHRLDVRDREGWAATLEAFCGADGRLDVLFNNAGVAQGGPLALATDAELDRVVAINLMGPLNGARAAHPYLKAAGGVLLNTASAAGIYGAAGLVPYSATKFGVRAMTEGLDGEWAADGIRVRSLMPGFIDTPLIRGTVTGTNRSIRDAVEERGLEITPVETVAEAAWRAVHGKRLHTPVGKTAKRLMFLARWTPGLLRRGGLMGARQAEVAEAEAKLLPR